MIGELFLAFGDFWGFVDGAQAPNCWRLSSGVSKGVGALLLCQHGRTLIFAFGHMTNGSIEREYCEP